MWTRQYVPWCHSPSFSPHGARHVLSAQVISDSTNLNPNPTFPPPPIPCLPQTGTPAPVHGKAASGHSFWLSPLSHPVSCWMVLVLPEELSSLPLSSLLPLPQTWLRPPGPILFQACCRGLQNHLLRCYLNHVPPTFRDRLHHKAPPPAWSTVPHTRTSAPLPEQTAQCSVGSLVFPAPHLHSGRSLKVKTSLTGVLLLNFRACSDALSFSQPPRLQVMSHLYSLNKQFLSATVMRNLLGNK